MLKKIILCFTPTYEEEIENSREYAVLREELKKYGTVIEIGNIKKNRMADGSDFSEKGQSPLEKRGILYLSDNTEDLSFLQNQGCYTIAVYHDGVSGMLSGTKFAMEGLGGMEWEDFNRIYQRFTGQPWEAAQTARCTLREMTEGDLEDLYELYSSPLVTRYMEGLFEDKEQEKQYIKDYIENVYVYYGFGTWLIHRKQDGKLIGRAGFNYRPGFDEVELGFIIGEPYWRKGYAYEVCFRLMEMGKSVYGFDKVQALVKRENEASIRLLEKLGFIYIEDIRLDGEECQRYLSELAISKNTTYNS